MATASDVWQGFRHWRRRRPFWGGLLLLLAGVELFLSANETIGDLQVHIGQQGFLSYLLPVILVLCGLLVWFTPAQRLFYGILGLLTALYSMIGLNLGGFFLGMLIGIVGGALAIAWVPRRLPDVPLEQTPVAAETGPIEDPIDSRFVPGFDEHAKHPEHAEHAAAPEDTAVLVDPGPASPPASSPPPAPVPSPVPEGEPPATPPPGSGVARQAFVIALVPLLATAALLVAGRTPARAADCPEGLPSRSVAATTSPASTTASTTAAAIAKKSTKKKATPQKTTAGTTPPKGTTPSPSASTAAGDDDEEGDTPILDGIKNGIGTIVNGVGKILGIGDDPTATPTPTEPDPAPTTTAPTTPPTTAAPTTTAPATTTTTPPGTPAPSATPGGGTSAPAGSASPSPTPTPSDIPCLGPRVLNKVASPDDVPTVTAGGGLLEGDKLTMYDSTYDGVATLKTSTGTVEALKFSMTKSVTSPFSLDIPESGGTRTLIKSNTLTTDGDVRFYTPRFEGNLFGVIPVVFTPEQPPPLTLPVLWFTDVKIQLSFVRCDTLTADPLNLSEPSA